MSNVASSVPRLAVVAALFGLVVGGLLILANSPDAGPPRRDSGAADDVGAAQPDPSVSRSSSDQRSASPERHQARSARDATREPETGAPSVSASRPGELSGNVVDDVSGQPIAAFRMYWLTEGAGEIHDLATSGRAPGLARRDANGAFRLTGLRDGTYTLLVDAAESGYGRAAVHGVGLDDGQCSLHGLLAPHGLPDGGPDLGGTFHDLNPGLP